MSSFCQRRCVTLLTVETTPHTGPAVLTERSLPWMSFDCRDLDVPVLPLSFNVVKRKQITGLMMMTDEAIQLVLFSGFHHSTSWIIRCAHILVHRLARHQGTLKSALKMSTNVKDVKDCKPYFRCFCKFFVHSLKVISESPEPGTMNCCWPVCWFQMHSLLHWD